MSWFTRLIHKPAKPSHSTFDPVTIAGAPLVEAVEAGDMSRVKAALAQGIHPDASHVLDCPVLITAIEKGRAEIVEALLEGGADPNTAGWGETALTAAIEQGDARIVQGLIAAGADVSLPRVRGDLTPKQVAVGKANAEIIRLIEHASGADQASPAAQLRAAAGAGDVAGVKQLLGAGGLTAAELGAALQWAARNNHGPDTVEIARALLAAGADVDFHDEEDPRTPVRSAAEAKNVELLRFLIGERADPTIGDERGVSPMYLCGLGEEEISNLLKSARPRKLDSDTLVAAAGAGAREIVRQALDAGVDANAKSRQGECLWPALVVAAGARDIETLKLLLDRGADPNCQVEGSPSQTPLRNAVLAQDEAAVRTLIAAGADVDHRTPSGEDAIDLAYWCGARDIAQILIESKMRVTST